ncbi:hypothetical protein GLYMA_14G173450v4 [Glycine max]|nr:hypothetical protein GLYMA_14G173450v4 [Glycine max]KAH1095024.1 hypothetical protein GYH30_040355 [Glycine max]
MLEKKISYATGSGIQGGLMQWSGLVKNNLGRLVQSHF